MGVIRSVFLKQVILLQGHEGNAGAKGNTGGDGAAVSFLFVCLFEILLDG